MDPTTGLAGMLSLSALAVFALVPYLLLGLAIPYAVLRLRDGSGGERDPQLGLKALLYFAFSLAVLVVLSGLTVVAVDALTSDRPPVIPPRLAAPPGFDRTQPPAPFNPPGRRDFLGALMSGKFTAPQRTGAALTVAGLLLAALHWFLIARFTNARLRPDARRVFVGWRLAIHTVIVVFAAVALFVLFFDEVPNGQAIETVGGVALVWLPSWLIHLRLLMALSRQSPPRPQAVPEPTIVRPA